MRELPEVEAGHGGAIPTFPDDDIEMRVWCGSDGSPASADEGTGMLLAELLAPDPDTRTFEEVLAEIDDVLNEYDHSLCHEAEYMCSECYDQESAYIARGVLGGRVKDPLVLEWSIAVYVRFRAEVLDADRVVDGDPDGWFADHEFDEVEQKHVWLECGADCAVCLGDDRYLRRIRHSALPTPPGPRGWERFVGFPGDAIWHDRDGNA